MTHTLNLESARRLFHSRPPSTQLFGEIVEMLDVSKPLPPVLEEYLCEHFSAWPKEVVRPLPNGLLKDLFRGAAQHIGPWFNHIELEKNYPARTLVELFNTRACSHIDSVFADLDLQPSKISTLAESNVWERLRVLDLRNCGHMSQKQWSSESLCGLYTLLARAPLEALSLHRVHEMCNHIDLWANAPFWSTLRILGLSHLTTRAVQQHERTEYALAPDALDHLLDNSSLQTLSLFKCQLTDAHIERFATSPYCAHLHTLLLTHNAIQDDGAYALSTSSYLSSLRHLNLIHNEIESIGAYTLATSPTLAQLDTLSIASNPIGGEGIEALLQHEAYQRSVVCTFTELSIVSNRRNTMDYQNGSLRFIPERASLRSEGLNMMAFFDRHKLITLEDRFLDLDGRLAPKHDGFSLATMEILASSSLLRGVSVLTLNHTHLRDEHIEILARSPHLSSLRVLALGFNALTSKSLEILSHAQELPNLQVLMIYENAIDDNGIECLVSRTALPKLRVLLARNNPLTAHGELLVDTHFERTSLGW